MNHRKLKHVANISNRQFRRRVCNVVMEILDKVENMGNYEGKDCHYNDNVPSNAVSLNATRNIAYGEDIASNLVTISNNWHTDNSSESDEFVNHDGTCEYEENDCEHFNTLDSSLEEIEDNNLDKTSEFKNFVRNWTVEYAIKGNAVSDLLSHLKKYPCFSNLPKDVRTLLHTPRKCNVIDIEPGNYCHFGLSNGILDILSNDDLKRHKCKLEGVHIAVGIDGLPLCKSSSSTLWPILGFILPDGFVFIIGVYHGNCKPQSSALFLRNFVDEALLLHETGIEIDGVTIPFSIKYFVLDAPAKSFVLNVKGHTGFNSCTKCHVNGLSDHGRVYFMERNAQRRTNEEFRLHTDVDYHLRNSELEKLLNIDLIKCIPLDYMHLICLGVMRKLMYLWVGNGRRKRMWQLSSNKKKHISDALLQIKSSIPCEFVCKPRSLLFVKQWKATEYRQLLFYTGLLVLRHVLHEDVYKHFVELHVAVRILSCKDLHEYLDYAQLLLEHFLESFGIIYNNYLISHNVHGLIHITDDVRNFGSIENFSAFRFENFMHIIKKLIRKGERPLQQLFNRYNEMKCHKNEKEQNITNLDKLVPLESSAYNDIVPRNCKNPVYSKAVCMNFILSTKESANNCCALDDGSIVIVHQIVWHVQVNDFVIVGKKFLRKHNFYTTPCASSLLNTYIVSKLTLSDNRIWRLSQVKQKFFIMPYGTDEYVILPLLHNDIHR